MYTEMADIQKEVEQLRDMNAHVWVRHMASCDAACHAARERDTHIMRGVADQAVTMQRISNKPVVVLVHVM